MRISTRRVRFRRMPWLGRLRRCSPERADMSFSAPFIRRPVGTSLLAAGIFVLGMAAYRVLPVAPIPRVDYPMISVSASLPGADPEIGRAHV